MSGESLGEDVFSVSIYREAFIAFPGSIAQEIDFDVYRCRFVGFDVEHFVLEAGHQERLAWLTGFDRSPAPRTTPASGLAPLPKVVGLAKPDARLRLTGVAVVVGIGRGGVAAEREETTEGGEIRDDAQVAADGFDAPDCIFKGYRI